MKIRTALFLLLVVVAAAVCVRLGFWQIARLREKRELNAARTAALAAPPILVSGPPKERIEGRRVSARGRYDESRQVLLVAHTHHGSPGVEVVTPLVLDGGSTAVLVDRGWLYAADAATASPWRYGEPGPREAIGIAETMRSGAGGPAIRTATDSSTVYSARWLDRDSLAARLPYALLPFSIRQLPGPGVPEQPLRSAPQRLNEFTHVSYAIQWFLFAGILLVGTAALARSRGRAAKTDIDR
jgi:surfeit locus 1 family protein